METTYLIDTNILVYAYNEDVEFHEEALKILENALNKNINAAIADKSLFEFFAIITDKKRVESPITVDEAIEIIDFLVDSNIKIIYSSPFSFLKTLELTKKYQMKKQDIFDINLVALMIQNKIDTIITADDKHFKDVKEIKVFNPFKQQKNKETENVPGSLDHKEKIEEIPEPEKKAKEE
jgi:predicted nucleic acid-binding protein